MTVERNRKEFCSRGGTACAQAARTKGVSEPGVSQTSRRQTCFSCTFAWVGASVTCKPKGKGSIFSAKVPSSQVILPVTS